MRYSLSAGGKRIRPVLLLSFADAAGLKTEDAIILKNHGVIATGETVKEAATLVEFVEEIAKTQFVTHVLNSIE